MSDSSGSVSSRALGAVLSLFALAFMAWAGVLWDRSSVIIDNQTRILVQQGIFLTRLETMERDRVTHNAQGWHSEAGNILHELSVRVKSLESHNAGRYSD